MEASEEPGAQNPPTPERPEGGPDPDNQPPAPPAESDPKQDYGQNEDDEDGQASTGP